MCWVLPAGWSLSACAAPWGNSRRSPARQDTGAPTALNFFLPGAGYLVLGHKVALSMAWLVGVIGLTYVELGIQTAAPTFYWPMFGSVLVMNTAFAVDAFRAGRARQQRTVATPV